MARIDETGERTELPTPLRLKEAARRGQVARSGDLTAAVVVVAAVVLLALAGGRLLNGLTRMTAVLLDGRGASPTSLAGTREAVWNAAVPVGRIVAVVGLAMVMVAVAVNVLQVGLIAAGQAPRPDLSRISPAAGIGRLLSRRSLVRGILAAAKFAGVGVVGFITIAGELPALASLTGMEAGPIARQIGAAAVHLTLRVGLVLLVLGIVDYLYQRWQHREDLKMTRRELADERKRTEGQPVARRRQRGLIRRMIGGDSKMQATGGDRGSDDG